MFQAQFTEQRDGHFCAVLVWHESQLLVGFGTRGSTEYLKVKDSCEDGVRLDSSGWFSLSSTILHSGERRRWSSWPQVRREHCVHTNLGTSRD